MRDQLPIGTKCYYQDASTGCGVGTALIAVTIVGIKIDDTPRRSFNGYFHEPFFHCIQYCGNLRYRDRPFPGKRWVLRRDLTTQAESDAAGGSRPLPKESLPAIKLPEISQQPTFQLGTSAYYYYQLPGINERQLLPGWVLGVKLTPNDPQPSYHYQVKYSGAFSAGIGNSKVWVEAAALMTTEQLIAVNYRYPKEDSRKPEPLATYPADQISRTGYPPLMCFLEPGIEEEL